MTDIVERLLHPGHGPLANEAAHEIERLRAIVAVAYQLAGFYDAPVRFLDAFSGHERYASMSGEQIIDALLPLTADQPNAGQRFPADGQPADKGVARAEVVPPPYGAGAHSSPKRAYYETHEPPHCPTCECWREITPDNSPEAQR